MRNINLSQYFTAPEVSAALMSFMFKPEPAVVLDLGVGAGALSLAAVARWPKLKVITVDIDDAVLRRCGTDLPHPRHVHFRADALSQDLPRAIATVPVAVGAAICNPPYRVLKLKPSIKSILEEAGLISALDGCDEVGTDVVFLAQNLRVVRTGGQIGIIVPDGFANAKKLGMLRSHILQHHRIDCVIKLPTGSFIGTEARAHLLILTVGEPTKDSVRLYKLTRSGTAVGPVAVAKEQAAYRLDYDFHKFRAGYSDLPKTLRLKDLDFNLSRGSFTSAEVRSTSTIFHTGDFPKIGRTVDLRRFTHSAPPTGSTQVLAQTGDILIARVGRNLEHQVCMVRSGMAHISDCVFRLRVRPKWRKVLLDALTSSQGRDFLGSIKQGAAAPYITKEGLIELRLPAE